MYNRTAIYCLFLSCLVYFPLTWANDVSVSGFGTLAYSYEDKDDLGFMRDLSQPLDISSNGSWLSDSRFGLQIDYSLNSHWRMAAQAVVKDRVSKEWSDAVEIAFLGYQSNQHWDFRFGRLPPDAFWATETRNIDYGHNWVRPPLEVYSWLPFQSVDGFDALYHVYSSNIDWYISSQLGYIRTVVESPFGEAIEAKGSELISLTLKATWNEWRVRSSVIYTPNITTEVTPLVRQSITQLDGIASMGLGSISQEAQSISNQLAIEDEAMLYTQVGIEYFNGHWLASSEIVSIHSESKQVIVPSGVGGYVALSYYLDGWSPYVIGSMFSPDVDALSAQNDWSLVAPVLGGVQNQLIDNINASHIEQHTISLGLRWDLMNNLALKAQVDFVEIAPNGYGLWSNSVTLNDTETKLELYTVSMNFVF